MKYPEIIIDEGASHQFSKRAFGNPELEVAKQKMTCWYSIVKWNGGKQAVINSDFLYPIDTFTT